MNTVNLIGRLTRDPEVTYLPNGTPLAKFSLAWTEKYKNSGGEWVEKAHFFDVTIWGKRGEAFAKFHKKGALAAVSGQLQFDQWEDKATGQKRSKVSVKANEWSFCSSGSREGGEPREREDERWPVESRPFSEPTSSAPHVHQGHAAVPLDVDDTPF